MDCEALASRNILYDRLTNSLQIASFPPAAAACNGVDKSLSVEFGFAFPSNNNI